MHGPLGRVCSNASVPCTNYCTLTSCTVPPFGLLSVPRTPTQRWGAFKSIPVYKDVISDAFVRQKHE